MLNHNWFDNDCKKVTVLCLVIMEWHCYIVIVCPKLALKSHQGLKNGSDFYENGGITQGMKIIK